MLLFQNISTDECLIDGITLLKNFFLESKNFELSKIRIDTSTRNIVHRNRFNDDLFNIFMSSS